MIPQVELNVPQEDNAIKFSASFTVRTDAQDINCQIYFGWNGELVGCKNYVDLMKHDDQI